MKIPTKIEEIQEKKLLTEIEPLQLAFQETVRTGTFEMRSCSERMHTWRRTPSTGRNFQTLIIWITVS